MSDATWSACWSCAGGLPGTPRHTHTASKMAVTTTTTSPGERACTAADRPTGWRVARCSPLHDLRERMPGYTIDMIDVGQGDAFVVASDGVSCLVDAGSAGGGGVAVSEHIQKHFGGKLTYALLTHVDDDHIAGFQRVLKAGIRP